MTAPIGWLAARFDRKPVFTGSIIGFTFASMLRGVTLLDIDPPEFPPPTEAPP